MQRRIFATSVMLALLTPIPASAQAEDSASCKNGDLIRRIEVAAGKDGAASCQVNYTKDTEAPGVNQVLWSAQFSRAYCVEKARELTAKLQSTGWTCEGSLAGAPSEASAPAATPSPSADAAPEASSGSNLDE